METNYKKLSEKEKNKLSVEEYWNNEILEARWEIDLLINKIILCQKNISKMKNLEGK